MPLLGAALLLLAACAPVDGPAERAPERGPVQVDTSLGVVRVAPGSPVVVRIVLDTQGDPEELGEIIEAAFRAGVEDFGSVQQGFRVELGDIIATDCSRAGGEEAGRALAEAAGPDGIVAVLGPQCTETLLGLQQQAAEAGLVVVTPRPQEVTLTAVLGGVMGQDRAAGTWRTAPSSLREAEAAAEFAFSDLEVTRAATVHDGTIEASVLADAFRVRFESLGGTVVVARQIDGRFTGDDEEAAEQALTTLLDDLAAGDIGLVFLPLEPAELLAVGDALAGRSRLASVTRMTVSAAASSEFLGAEGSLGLVFAGPVLDFDDAVNSVTGMSASQTLERIRATTGARRPSGWWAYSYDAATLLMKALEDASLVDVDGTFVLSRAELRETFSRSALGGLTGTLRCTPLGDCAAARIAIRSHEDPSAADLIDLVRITVLGD